jgi:hypothetical protein
MRTIRSLLNKSFIGLALLSGATVLMPSAQAEIITGGAGDVRAEISYEQPQEYKYKNVRLQIIRAGKTLLDRNVSEENQFSRPIGDLFPGKQNNLPVIDLNGDQEPEIIVNFLTLGAHCCIYSLIYHYDSKVNQYNKIRQYWGGGGYELKNLDEDRILEFVSRDERFASVFTSYAVSGYPLQIWQYRQGKMIDVTRSYPKLISADATRLWKAFLEVRKQGDDGKGFLAPYLANMYMLGKEQEGWQRVEQAYRRQDREKYFAHVREFLRQTGYVR